MDFATFTKNMTGEELAYAENMAAQRDDGIAQAAAAAQAISDANSAHAAELAARDAELQKIKDDHAALIEAVAAQHAKALKTATDQLADKAALVEALGGTELGQQMAKQKAIDAALAEKAAIEKKLADLGAGSDVLPSPSPVLLG